MKSEVHIKLEEYIPLKIVFSKDEEVTEYISYSKNKTSFLEIVIGTKSRQIKKIILLLCKEFSETMNELVVESYEEEKINFNGNNIECNIFETILYCNGARIIVSDKISTRYVKMDKVYLGLSDIGNITEICVCDMSDYELKHLKTELELQ